MVVGRRAAKATAVVKVAGPVEVMAEEARSEARPDARGESESGKGGKGDDSSLLLHLSPEGVPRTCRVQGSAFGPVLRQHPSR